MKPSSPKRREGSSEASAACKKALSNLNRLQMKREETNSKPNPIQNVQCVPFSKQKEFYSMNDQTNVQKKMEDERNNQWNLAAAWKRKSEMEILGEVEINNNTQLPIFQQRTQFTTQSQNPKQSFQITDFDDNMVSQINSRNEMKGHNFLSFSMGEGENFTNQDNEESQSNQYSNQQKREYPQHNFNKNIDSKQLSFVFGEESRSTEQGDSEINTTACFSKELEGNCTSDEDIQNLLQTEEMISQILSHSQNKLDIIQDYFSIHADAAYSISKWAENHQNGQDKAIYDKMIILERVCLSLIYMRRISQAGSIVNSDSEEEEDCGIQLKNCLKYIQLCQVILLSLLLDYYEIEQDEDNEHAMQLLADRLNLRASSNKRIENLLLKQNKVNMIFDYQLIMIPQLKHVAQTISQINNINTPQAYIGNEFFNLLSTDNISYEQSMIIIQSILSDYIHQTYQIQNQQVLQCNSSKNNKSKKNCNEATITPLLPQINKKVKSTLVIELIDTLIRIEQKGELLVRPNAAEFLQQLSEQFEIVVFTVASQEMGEFMLKIVDKHQVVSYLLDRKNMSTSSKNIQYKNLELLGRDLSKLVVVDSKKEHFILHPRNGILIQTWEGQHNDTTLIDLLPLLLQIPRNKKYKDSRDALQAFREKVIQNMIDGRKDPLIGLVLE